MASKQTNQNSWHNKTQSVSKLTKKEESSVTSTCSTPPASQLEIITSDGPFADHLGTTITNTTQAASTGSTSVTSSSAFISS